MCKYCENGKINKLGEEWFLEMPFEIIGNISHNRPVIFKTNGKYFMKVENFFVLEVIACPLCGASFETPVLSTDEDKDINVGDMVKIVEGPDANVYRENEFEVLSEPYEIGGEVVVKMKCHRLTSKDTIKVKPNTNYVISVDNYTKSNPYWDIRGLNEPMTNISNPWQVGTQIIGMVNSFNSGKYEYIVIRQWYDIATNGVDANAQIQIEEGKTKSEFEPYVEPVTTFISINEPLRKIGDYAD